MEVSGLLPAFKEKEVTECNKIKINKIREKNKKKCRTALVFRKGRSFKLCFYVEKNNKWNNLKIGKCHAQDS